MTALNAFARADAAYILTDGASFFTQTGKIGSIGGKTIASRRLRLAIGRSGMGEPMRLRWFLSRMPDQATAIERLPAELVASANRLRPGLARDNARNGATHNLGTPLTIYVALFDCDASEARIYQCDAANGMKRISAGLQPIIGRYEGLRALDLTHPATFDVWRDAVGLVQAQRDRPLAEGEHCMVGGFVELVRVDAEGVSRRIMHRWPDRVGQKPGYDRRIASTARAMT